MPQDAAEPSYDALFGRLPEPERLSVTSISRLFYYSLALSAWKQITGRGGRVQSRWSLRVNPSSGNLHPTEGYLICGPVAGLTETPAVFHYAPFEHGLELRRRLDAANWRQLCSAAGGECLLVGLTSIYWREAWKYGERAFRYCHHDAGHAIGAVAVSAACLGWRTRLAEGLSTGQIEELLGVGRQNGPEAEHADCLLVVSPGEPPIGAVEAAVRKIRGSEWFGSPNRLSQDHHPWPVIDEVSQATRSEGNRYGCDRGAGLSRCWPDRGKAAHGIIRRRRSAVAMDGETGIERASFYRMLWRTLPGANPMPYSVLPWKPRVSLALFVHRVKELPPGLYLLVRDPSHEPSLRESLCAEFGWRRPECCPEGLDLYLLKTGDFRAAARTISCHQEIASDGAWSAGMLAEFDAALTAHGPAMYPRLFWETGLIGQVLYLEAEAEGIRATGIGCFFDDAMHELLGIRDHGWQSLYHFTVGGPLEDARLQTIDAYEHLRVRELQGEAAWQEA